ncbi:MAG: hypothetical protein ACT4OE_11700 [Sphingosinicella sp.]
MARDRRDVIEAGRWLRSQREALGASTALVARFATLIANRQGDAVTIYQQQLSEIENATRARGPKSLRPWFRYVRAAFDSGTIADALGKGRAQAGPVGDRTLFVHDEEGRVVGRLTLFGEPRPQ